LISTLDKVTKKGVKERKSIPCFFYIIGVLR